VIRYHLALGAGSPECAGTELRYVHEQVLQVLGTFAVVPASAAAAIANTAPGLSYDPGLVLHGEHEIELFGVLPVAGESTNRARIDAVYDKRSAAHVVVEVDTELADGRLVARNRFRLIVAGAGGFGGDPGPVRAPEDTTRAPDAEYHLPTLPQQAALYRMSGDRTPLHVDPAVARAAGFERPTLQGLCTWAMVAKAMVDGELDGDAARLTGFAARFAGPVYPGETLRIRTWRDDDGMRVQADVAERAAPALTYGRFRYTD
jgi:acyl dehydratase